MTIGWRFDNTYSKLPDYFLSNTIPTPVKSPELIILNDSLTEDLGLNFSEMNKENLAKYDAILFNNTTHLVFQNDTQRDAMLNFLKQGKGVAGIHAASDNFYKWNAAARMVGGQFDGHPWNAGGTWSFKLNDPKHTLNLSLIHI